MITTQYSEAAPIDTNDALGRVPARTFGETDWVTLALKNCAAYLEPAIASGKAFRIASAIRTIAHAPTAEQVGDVVEAVCDSVLTDAYTKHNSRMISNVAGARPVIQSVLTELNEQTQRAAIEPALLRETVDGLVRVVALSDKRLAARLDAVGGFAARIADAMHLDRSVVLDTEFAGRLHDIGMVSVPRDRGHKAHPLTGETFVAGIPALAHLAPIVRGHHEAYDGSGYPDGLHGEEIPIASRIIAIAGTFMDLISETSRHKALLPDDACREIAQRAGSKFDPHIVEITLELLHYRQRSRRSA